MIVLRYFCDLSERETEATLRISIGAVKSATSRGLATLRTLHPEGAVARTRISRASLRTSLRAAADRHALELDVDDVIDAGQEVLTRRTRRWAAASVGLVAAAAMVAGGVWQGSAKTSQAPASTPSAANAATLVLDLNDVVPGRPAKLQVRTKHVPGATEVELAGLAEDGARVGPSPRGTIPATRAADHLVLDQRLADHCALVLVRGAATDIQRVTASNATGGGPGRTYSGPTHRGDRHDRPVVVRGRPGRSQDDWPLPAVPVGLRLEVRRRVHEGL